MVVDDRNQEETPDPVLATTPCEEDDQRDSPEDNMILEDQVSRKQLAPHHQEPVQEVVPETSTKSKVQTGGQKMFISVRGVKLSSPGGRGRQSKKGECQHQRGGYCLLHGEGAIKKTRMISKTISGPGGKSTKKLSKQTYYICKEDNVTGGALRQSQLSFFDNKKTTEPAEEDAKGGNKSSTHFSLTTEGQCGTDMSYLPGCED